MENIYHQIKSRGKIRDRRKKKIEHSKIPGDLWVEEREGKQEKEAFSLCFQPI